LIKGGVRLLRKKKIEGPFLHGACRVRRERETRGMFQRTGHTSRGGGISNYSMGRRRGMLAERESKFIGLKQGRRADSKSSGRGGTRPKIDRLVGGQRQEVSNAKLRL